MKKYLLLLALSVAFMISCGQNVAQNQSQADSLDNGWVKFDANPVLGGPQMGTCFDVNVLKSDEGYDMYFSWRPKKSIAVVHSKDGVSWSEPEIILEYNMDSGWEDNVNRTCTILLNGKYHMWYTGQARGFSKIGYAVSDDGKHFERVTNEPVIIPEYPHEGFSVMNPYVIRDEERGVFRMWYASGETYEPNVICYAESTDGINWEKSKLNPVLVKGEPGTWEQDRVGGCEVHKLKDGSFVMFYIGYADINSAKIGAAVSKDGITGWKRLQANPLVSPTPLSWDADACYKPSAYMDEAENCWKLWYNGRKGSDEYIGMVIHEGLDLGALE